MFVKVTEENIEAAAKIHSESWRESHKSFCSEEFVKAHSPERQVEYLRSEMSCGKQIFMLVLDSPKGIVSIHHNLIENLLN